MDDKTLLELAAKAINKKIWFDKEEHCRDAVGSCDRWNPLTDNGDALKLAVKLRIDILFDGDGVEVYGENGVEALPANGDLESATRRAITRAAAEIGKVTK